MLLQLPEAALLDFAADQFVHTGNGGRVVGKNAAGEQFTHQVGVGVGIPGQTGKNLIDGGDVSLACRGKKVVYLFVGNL